MFYQINYPADRSAAFVFHSVHYKLIEDPLPMDFHAILECEYGTAYRFHSVEREANYC